MEKNLQPNQKSPRDYWARLILSRQNPNFWMTEEYVGLAGLEWAQEGDLWGWREKDQPEWFLPPMGPTGFQLDQPIWAGFPSHLLPPIGCQLLDHQYIYDAWAFLSLDGPQWRTFRKNIRKYPNRVKGHLEYHRLSDHESEDEIAQMITTWAEGRVVYDPEVMVAFLLMGSLRWGLFLDGRLVGVNVADATYIHGVYRYCMDDGTPFLNEYLRWCFYTSPWAQEHRWINDGGDLNNPQLEAFKRKLNPYMVENVYHHNLPNPQEEIPHGPLHQA